MPDTLSSYTVQNWYWQIGSDTTQVWSSARASYVPVSDPVYVDWLTVNVPTPIPTMSELEDIFAARYPRGTLKTYNADARYRRATGGLTISSLSPVPFFSDPVARNTLANANTYAHNVEWKLSDGTFIPLTPAQLTTATNAMANFVQSCFTMEGQNLAAITGGTITTLAEIDTAFASIANVVP